MTSREQQAAEAAIDAWFAAMPDLRVERGKRTWLTVLEGRRKRTVPLRLTLGDHTLTAESFFLQAPDERLADVYRLLLRRNVDSYVLRFVLSDSGDIHLLGVLPVHAVTTEELDRLFGQLLTVADDTYWPAIRLAFAGYVEREQAWRALRGMPRNPIT